MSPVRLTNRLQFLRTRARECAVRRTFIIPAVGAPIRVGFVLVGAEIAAATVVL